MCLEVNQVTTEKKIDWEEASSDDKDSSDD